MTKRFDLTSLVVFNPSPYDRYDFITVPWAPIRQEVGAESHEIVVRDPLFDTIEHQIDRPVPGVETHDVIMFRPYAVHHQHRREQPLPPGPADYSSPSRVLSVQRGGRDLHPIVRAWVDIKEQDGRPHVAGLCNGRLSVWINLTPGDASGSEHWYAGCATSVRVPFPGRPHGLEALDVFRSVNNGWLDHDREKRCMQVDRVQLVDDQGNAISEEVPVFDRSYELVSRGNGPLRSYVTIAVPFEAFVAGRSQRYVLYRVISLYVGMDHVMEELFLGSDSGSGVMEPTDIDRQRFRVRYFSHMDMSMEEENVFRYPYVPDWFALGSTLFPPYPGYGFATDAHVGEFLCDKSDRPDAYKRFGWKTEPSLRMTCLHLFMLGKKRMKRGEFGHFDARAGRAWYEFVFKKLWAEVA